MRRAALAEAGERSLHVTSPRGGRAVELPAEPSVAGVGFSRADHGAGGGVGGGGLRSGPPRLALRESLEQCAHL